MKISFIFLFCLLNCNFSKAQQYKITTDQTDEFSIAFVKLLQCGIDRFNDCKGAFLQTTMMSETEDELTIRFPNSIAGIIRSGSWDKNAYIEFGPFKREDLPKEIKRLKEKISLALGKQLYKDDRNEEKYSFYSMSIADENGYFESSFEIFSGNTSEKSYLLKPVMKMEDSNAPKHNFLLLKVESGIPAYYHYVPKNIPVPDKALHKTLQQLINSAPADFKALPVFSDTSLKKKKLMSFELNGQTVWYNGRRGNHSISIRIPAAQDSIAFRQQWQYYQQVMQAAAGEGFVYHMSELSFGPWVLFFDKQYNQQQPRLYLTVQSWKTKDAHIQLEIQSNISHPVKRSASFDDEEEDM